MLPSFDRGRVQSRIKRGSRRWRSRIDSRGINLERDWSQFLTRASSLLMPRGKLEQSRNCQRRSQASRSVQCNMSLGVEQNSRT